MPNRIFNEKRGSLKKLINQILTIILVTVSLIGLYLLFATVMGSSKKSYENLEERNPKSEEDYLVMDEVAKEYETMRKFEEYKIKFGKKYNNQEEENQRYSTFKTQLEEIERLNRQEKLSNTTFGVNEFGKKYNNQEEENQRYSTFKNQLEEIERLNRHEHLSNTIFGVNEFADMSDEEFKKMLLPIGSVKKYKENSKFIKPLPQHLEKANGHSLDDYPAHFDWREKGVVTPVKSQAIPGAGYCGSCWAAAATVESAYAIKYHELKNLSSQQLLDCDQSNNGCDGGDDDKAFEYVHEHGLMTWEDYPYVAQRQNSCLLHGNKTTSLAVAYQLNPDELSIIDWLVNYGPVNIGINVPPDMKPYAGGIYHPSDYDCMGKILGTHALNIVGYGTSDAGEKYWIIKNSWGQNWGIEKGYYYMARGINSCGVEDEPIGLLA
uniref:Uncharacterized protein n=1 Tax=Acrobeloides nanus TaxID=290746 RepID=A0A914E368_9BILA